MDKSEGVKPPESAVTRRSFLRKAATIAGAVLLGAFSGVGSAKDVQAPGAPKPQAKMKSEPPRQTISSNSQPIEATLIGKRVGSDPKSNTFEGPRSKANDHKEWGISIDDDIGKKPLNKPVSAASTNNAASSLPSQFEEQVVGMTYDQVRALPNDDPMKEELLRQFTQQVSIKKPS